MTLFTDFGFPIAQRASLLNQFHDAGQQWIEAFPLLVNKCQVRWSLKIVTRVDLGQAVNVVYFAELPSGKECVLKISYPHAEQENEALYLREIDNDFMVTLLDQIDSVMLLERVRSGSAHGYERMLKADINNPKIIASALEIFSSLPKPIKVNSYHLPTYRHWMDIAFLDYKNNCGDINEVELESQKYSSFLDVLARADMIFSVYESKHLPLYLLHGDLHHENILLAEKGRWRVIDPKGVISFKVLECGRYIHNFLALELSRDESILDVDFEDLSDIMHRRILQLKDICGYQYEDLANVAYIDATLATCWHLNSNQDAREGLKIIEACSLLLPAF